MQFRSFDLAVLALSIAPTVVTTVLLQFRRTATAGTGLFVGLYAVGFFVNTVDHAVHHLRPPSLVAVDELTPFQLAGAIARVMLVLGVVAWHRQGRFAQVKGRHRTIAAGALPLVYLAADWLPWVRIPVTGLGGPGYLDCCVMFRYEQDLYSDLVGFAIAVGAVVVLALAGGFASRGVAGGMAMGTAVVFLPTLLISLSGGPILLPGYWLAVGAVAAMFVYGFLLFTQGRPLSEAPS
ncbi:hypothetical protein N5079_03630 [Planotetraspora sp. A-T 1434]|uniref:hypothetical protein n=1 Tax=Planotetraspora sp. A-T 1434 TaxID=2979219 RepID=UPI0021C13825|nr:hypothetical protein [Planotetraspora sp. A-T 1434]MCT9929305.1 hypothetical protein [Planotetraspora sp. A-T 1434]